MINVISDLEWDAVSWGKRKSCDAKQSSVETEQGEKHLGSLLLFRDLCMW